MAIIKCKMCGGDIELSADKTYGTCDSCGSTMTFPKVSDEQRANLFNRANHFRRQNEFDKAVSAYERILDEDDTDAEAHWGVVLSRYGIEYVEDPVSHERIPTCHRVQSASILTDADYLAALEYAPDAHSKELYEQEARRIADIQKGILAISSKEEPYDVFICYKESTDGGSRTKDSTLAQDIYYQLTQDGYKVFFSRITLEDKLGQQYEPYIFAALNSARVMVVVGTKPEYFNAVWVKNEWSRYLALMKQDKSRLLIPCYRDMDPYDLPEELSALQSLDMGKIGFMQDLVHGIQKVLEKKAEPQTARVSDVAAAPGVTSLLKRAKLFLEDGDFASADEYAEKVLDIDPECAAAYLVKVLVSRQLKTETELGEGNVSLANDANYAKALRFAMPEQKQTYAAYEQSIQENIRQARLEEAYKEADRLFKIARTDADFRRAATAFKQLKDFSDASRRMEICQKAADEAYANRKKAEEELAAKQAQKELEHKRQEEVRKRKWEQNKRRNRTLALIFGALLTICLAVGLLLKQVIFPRNDYSAAVALMNNRQYDEAVAAFSALGDYSDSAEQVKACRYQKAQALMDNQQYDEAIILFNELGNYSDSVEQIKACFYQKAQTALETADLDSAKKFFIQVADYQDSQELAAKIDQYQKAQGQQNNQKYADAYSSYSAISGFIDADTQKEACGEQVYTIAMAAKHSDDLDKAYKLLKSIPGYRDSDVITTKIEADYQTALTQFANAQYKEAVDSFASLYNYEDSNLKRKEALYAYAGQLAAASQWEDALTAYQELGDYQDAAAQCLTMQEALAETAFASKDYATALAYYIALPQTDERKAREYTLAQTCYDEENYQVAVDAYEALGQYELSAQRLPLAQYAYANQLFQQGQYLEACEQFSQIKEVSDSSARADESKYQAAKVLQAEGQFAQAESYYAELGSYSDAAEQANACRYSQAVQEMTVGHYEKTAQYFEALGDYQDSATQAKEAHYQWAVALMSAKDYTSAEQQYALLAKGRYKDSADKMNACILAQADTAFSAGHYAVAEELYRSLPTSNDITAQINACLLAQAKEKMNGGSYNAALTFLDSINDDSGAEATAECHYQLGLSAQREGNTPKAVQEFAQAILLDKAKDALCQIGKDYASVNENAHAIETLAVVANYEPARKLLSEIAELLQTKQQNELVYIVYVVTNDEAARKERLAQVTKKSLAEALVGFDIGWDTDFANKVLYQHAADLESTGQHDKATAAFENLGEYADASTRAKAAQYQKAVELLDNKDYDKASEAFKAAGDYQDAVERIGEPYYIQAEKMLAAGQLIEAIDSFQKADGYKDAQQRLLETCYVQGEIERKAGNYGRALLYFGKAGKYSDAHVQVQEIQKNFISLVAAGSYHTVGLKTNGTVIAVGDNGHGQCNVDSWTDIIAVSAGLYHTIGLKADGTVVAVGDNQYGQCDVDSWKDIIEISASTYCTVGLKNNGTVVATGYNEYGQCNVGSWKNIIAVSTSGGHTIGLKSDGTLVVVGNNYDGRCNINSWKNIISVSAGVHSIGLKDNRTVIASGNNKYGQCAVGSWTDIIAISAGAHYTIGIKADGTVIAVGDNEQGQCDIDSWTDIIAVSAGLSHTVGLKVDGTLVAVGDNSYGQCNVGSWTNIGGVQPSK